MLQTFFPVLAADFNIVGAVILIISVLSWGFNWFKENKPEPPQNRNRPRPNNGGQSELEKFLQDVVKKNEPQPNRPAPSPKPPRPEVGEKKKPKPRPSPAQPQTQLQGARTPAAARPVTRLGQSSLPPLSGLGEGVRTHVASHLETRNVDTKVERDINAGVRRDIESKVQKDVGTDLGKDTTRTAQRTEAVHPLMQALRSPQGVRQAILMAEILDRPKSLR